MTAVSLPISLQLNVRGLAAGGLRFTRDAEAARDNGPGYACFETELGQGGYVRVAAATDAANPTVVEFWVPGGPWGTEVELCGGVLGATVDGKLLGRISADARVDGVLVSDVIESVRAAAVAAGRHPFEIGPTRAPVEMAA